MFLSDWRVLLRRWYVVLLGLVATGALCALAVQLVPPTHRATSAVLLLPPQTADSEEPDNPFLALGGLDTVAGVLARDITDRATRDAIFDGGAQGGYTVEPDLISGGPVLLITAEAVSPDSALQTRDAVTDRLPRTLAELQVAAGVAESLQIRTKEITRDQTAEPVYNTLIRAVLVAAAGGVTATFLAVAALDGLLRRRADKRSARHLPSKSRRLPGPRRAVMPEGGEYRPTTSEAEPQTWIDPRVPVLATLPRVAALIDQPSLPVIEKTDSGFSLSVLQLRSALQALNVRQSGVVLAVSSSERGSGTTLVAANLAACYALDGKKTLLLSGDVHRPGVEDLFGITGTQPGFTSLVRALSPESTKVSGSLANGTTHIPSSSASTNGTPKSSQQFSLTGDNPIVRALQDSMDIIIVNSPIEERAASTVGEIEFTDYLVPTSVPGLVLMPAGLTSRTQQATMTHSRVNQVIGRMRPLFDVVVIDSPPVLEGTTASVLASSADGMILVVPKERRDNPLLRKTLERVQDDGVKLLGFAVNRS